MWKFVLLFTFEVYPGYEQGSGSCAAVLFPLTGAEEVQVETCAVGSRVSSLDCEIEGIALGITMAIKFFGQFVSRSVCLPSVL